MSLTYFWDIPVYRITAEKYNSDLQKFLRKSLGNDPNPIIEDHYRQAFGGSWRFNEIIGYIRLYFLGSQVRGEYFRSHKKRVVKTRRKIFESSGWKVLPEIEIPKPYRDAEIYAAIMEYLHHCKKHFCNQFVDTELFEIVGTHVEWTKLLGEQGSRNAGAHNSPSINARLPSTCR